MWKQVVKYLGIAVTIIIIWVSVKTEFFGNVFSIITGRGYIIPTESTVFSFKTLQMNTGSGEWWIYGKDDKYYYTTLDKTSEKQYIKISKNIAEECEGFDETNYNTWCIK